MKGDESVEKFVLMLVTGVTPDAAIAAGKASLGLTLTQAKKAVEKARRQITVAADYDRDVEVGTAYHRLNSLYSASLKQGDPKTALAAQKELNKLLDLYGARTPVAQTAAASAGDSGADVDAIRGHLAGAGVDSKYPLHEQVRVLVARVAELEAAKK